MAIQRILVFWGLTSIALTFWTLAWCIVTATLLKRQRMRYAEEVLEHMMALPAPEGATSLPVPDARTIEIVMDQQTRYDAGAGQQWVKQARLMALQIYHSKGSVTSDDVWAVIPPPEHVDGRLMSQVLSRDEWEIVGRVSSARGRNAARQIAVWKLKQSTMAEAAE